MLTGIVVSLLVCGLLCWLASLLIPPGIPANLAFVFIVLVCLGGYIGFGRRAFAQPCAAPQQTVQSFR